MNWCFRTVTWILICVVIVSRRHTGFDLALHLIVSGHFLFSNGNALLPHRWAKPKRNLESCGEKSVRAPRTGHNQFHRPERTNRKRRKSLDFVMIRLLTFHSAPLSTPPLPLTPPHTNHPESPRLGTCLRSPSNWRVFPFPSVLHFFAKAVISGKNS